MQYGQKFTTQKKETKNFVEFGKPVASTGASLTSGSA
jgi:hypothetical protein